MYQKWKNDESNSIQFNRFIHALTSMLLKYNMLARLSGNNINFLKNNILFRIIIKLIIIIISWIYIFLFLQYMILMI